MKKIAFALMAMAALVFGFGVVAEAQYGGGTGSMTFSQPNPSPGEPITINVTGCNAGEILTIAVDGQVLGTVTATGSATLGGSVVGLILPRQTGTGSATFPTTAPQQPGTYVYTCTGDQGCSLSATLVVSAAPATTPGAGGSGALPSTGSGGISQTTGIALGLLVVGLGLVIVAQIRRRTNPSLA